MSVGVDTSRNNEFIGAVDHFGTFVGKIAGNSGYLSLFDKNVSVDGGVGVDYSGVFEKVGAEISEDGSVD